MERLVQLVGGRTVGLLLHGSSVNGLSSVPNAVATPEVVWAGLNHFTLLEDSFLKPAGAEMSVVFCLADGEVERRESQLSEFLRRPAPRVLVMRPEHFAQRESALGHGRDAVLNHSLPSLWPYPNSLILFLRLLVQCSPRRIVLCGADGYLGENDDALPTYFGADNFKREGRLSGVLRDTLLFNAHFPGILERWHRVTTGQFPEILNCSPGSVLRGLPTIGHDQLAVALSGEPVKGFVPAPAAQLTVPLRAAASDSSPELTACANAARRGDLRIARQYALKALSLEPDRLSQLAFRVLQTDAATLAAAIRTLTNAGAADPRSPQHWRWIEFCREAAEAARATERWESWS